VVLTAASGCHKQRAEPSPAAASSKPVDRALPDELAEGTESAFGLPVPRRMRVDARFPDAVFASGNVGPELVAKYIRERVEAARAEARGTNVIFAEARIRAPATAENAPQRVVRIEITERAGRTELVVRDQTRPPSADGLSEEERWKRLGLRPDGRPLD